MITYPSIHLSWRDHICCVLSNESRSLQTLTNQNTGSLCISMPICRWKSLVMRWRNTHFVSEQQWRKFPVQLCSTGSILHRSTETATTLVLCMCILPKPGGSEWGHSVVNIWGRFAVPLCLLPSQLVCGRQVTSQIPVDQWDAVPAVFSVARQFHSGLPLRSPASCDSGLISAVFSNLCHIGSLFSWARVGTDKPEVKSM